MRKCCNRLQDRDSFMMLHGLGWLDRFPGSPEPEGKPGGPVDHKTARGYPLSSCTFPWFSWPSFWLRLQDAARSPQGVWGRQSPATGSYMFLLSAFPWVPLAPPGSLLNKKESGSGLPGGARRGQEEPGGARRTQMDPGGQPLGIVGGCGRDNEKETLHLS